MRNLSSGQCDEALLKSLFLEQLPQQVSAILSASSEQDLSKLALLADKILDLQRPANVNVVSNSSSNGVTEEFIRQIAALASRFGKFVTQGAQKNRGWSRSRSKQPAKRNGVNNNNGSKDSSLCYYHKRFGTEARKCHDPCTWVPRVNNTGN